MKKLIFIKVVFGWMLLVFILNSCANDAILSPSDYYTSHISYATMRPLSENGFYFTLDNGNTLWPVSLTHISQPLRPKRVQLNYSVLGENIQGYDYAIRVYRVDTILTKMPAIDMGAKNDSIYGDDPVDLLEMWTGDGFLNVIFKMEYTGTFKHTVNLIRDTTDASQYKFEFRHNAFNDKSQYLIYGVVAFDLSEINTKGEDITLVIKVKTFKGVKEYKKIYNSGRDLGLQPELKPELKFDKNSLNYLE